MIKIVGENHFNFRAISSLYFKNHVLWFMNNPNGNSFVVKYDRNSELLQKGFEFPGPVWYSFSSDNRHFLSTASEENTVDKVYLLSSLDGEKWDVISSYQKDKLNKKYFLYGLLSFPDQVIKDEKIMMYCEAIEKFDGRMLYEKI